MLDRGNDTIYEGVAMGSLEFCEDSVCFKMKESQLDLAKSEDEGNSQRGDSGL